MISFLKGIFYDQSNRISKMLKDLASTGISPEIDQQFLETTIEMLYLLQAQLINLTNSGDLEIESIAANNIIKYNTLHESLLSIELFRYLVIINYGEPEEYFKKKIKRIYKETNCLQKQPIITTISNSENYYWALPTYDIIAVPVGEERNLLNLPDIYHEMGHLIYHQHEPYLKGSVEKYIADFYNSEMQRVISEQRSESLIPIFRTKSDNWISSWIMEFTCDFIATYLTGPAYAWTNLKLTTLSCGNDEVYVDSETHPSDEARMRGIFFVLNRTGHSAEVIEIEKSWNQFLKATRNPLPPNYQYFFPQHIIEELARTVITGCENIGLADYNAQVISHTNPVSKILNDAWKELFIRPDTFGSWELQKIDEITDGFV